MENIVWLIVMVPCSALFTVLGIYALKRKKPMWFWSGKDVKEDEISDIPAYNKANGIMWISFSALLWLNTFFGLFNIDLGGIISFCLIIAGVPVLAIVYGKIYKKYKKTYYR